MNNNMLFNEEPDGEPSFGQAMMGGFNQMLGQGQNLMAQGQRLMPQATPEESVEEMIRRLRQERAQQSYERNFGQSFGNNQSMMSRGQGGEVEAMRQKVMNWNRSGKRNR